MSDMREFLEAVRTHLRASLDGFRDSDIYVAPHVDFVPAEARFPCLGIKDGRTGHEDLHDGTGRRISLEVQVAVMLQILRSPDAAIMGSGDSPGLLDICERVRTALHRAELPVQGLVECHVVEEEETALLDAGGKNILSRVLRIVAAVWR